MFCTLLKRIMRCKTDSFNFKLYAEEGKASIKKLHRSFLNVVFSLAWANRYIFKSVIDEADVS